jgi:2,4-dienoyl-CoA reductase-like NADH-dependent reductase (Old Yellow Enzyme family)
MFVRISSVDGLDGGRTIEDSVAFARELKARGVDVIDCSSGGLTGSATAARIPRGYNFQLPFAARIRKEAEIAAMGVGLIVHPQQAEDALAEGAADLIAIGRETMFDPNWPLHAEMALGAAEGDMYTSWPKQAGWWLERREPGLRKLEGPPLLFRTRANA